MINANQMAFDALVECLNERTFLENFQPHIAKAIFNAYYAGITDAAVFLETHQPYEERYDHTSRISIVAGHSKVGDAFAAELRLIASGRSSPANGAVAVPDSRAS